ncbi:MAG: sec-independent translocase [Propionicimonas sp.]|uniref:sec-independent translocase n=1 Tax=Propionicimonas sp. TaxID=1955623 RepID=UPI003D0C7073
MIDFNISEILVLAVLAVVIFGPEKLPELARKTARVINYLRNIANDAQGRLREELGPEFADLELTNPKAMVTKHLLDPMQAELEPVKSELTPLKAELEPVKAAVEGRPSYLPDPEPEPVPVLFDTEAT